MTASATPFERAKQMPRYSRISAVGDVAAAANAAWFKSHFFSIARGSATESGAALDLLLARGLVTASDHRRARSLLIRIVSMLAGLMHRFGHTDAGGR